jgi:hypothetical protein
MPATTATTIHFANRRNRRGNNTCGGHYSNRRHNRQHPWCSYNTGQHSHGRRWRDHTRHTRHRRECYACRSGNRYGYPLGSRNDTRYSHHTRDKYNRHTDHRWHNDHDGGCVRAAAGRA